MCPTGGGPVAPGLSWEAGTWQVFIMKSSRCWVPLLGWVSQVWREGWWGKSLPLRPHGGGES